MIGRRAPQQWWATHMPCVFPSANISARHGLIVSRQTSGLMIMEDCPATSSPHHSQSSGISPHARRKVPGRTAHILRTSPRQAPGPRRCRASHSPAAQPPVHLEGAGGDVTPDEEAPGFFQHGTHQAQQEIDFFHGEGVAEHLFTRRIGQREPDRLVECPFLLPADAPVIDVAFTIALMHDPFHCVVVVDPRHADIVTHRRPDLGCGDFQERCQSARRLGVIPHEDRHPVHRFAAERCVHTLLRGHESPRRVTASSTIAR